MESVNLDMEDIFDEQQEEEDFPSVGPLPDLPDPDQTEEQANGEDDENSAEVLSRLKDLSKGAAKKVVRKPQPKLDATRLTGERGIPVLPKLFEDVKFKGKGHEAQDLQIIMRYLEHWAHRLFPKMPFDEVLERIEKLGTKNEVKTCIKKMRLDMPVLNEDFIKNNDGEDDIDDNTDKNKQGDIDADAEEVFDEMMRAESESPASKTSAPRPTSHLATQLALPLSENPSDPMATGTPKPNSSNSQALCNGLTPEQRERMERNKRLAMEKRMNKHGPFKTPAPPSPRTPSRKVVSHTVNSSQGSPARMGPSSSQGPPAHFGPSSSQGSPVHTGISHDGVIQNNFVMPQSLLFSSYHSPTKCHQASMQHSPQQLPPYIGDGVEQATFRTLVDQSTNGNSSEMSTVFPMMNGNFLGQNTLSMNCPSQSMGNSSIASSDGYFPAIGSNPYNNSSQEMSEVYPVPHQNVPYTNSQPVQVRSDEHGQSQSIPLVNVDSKVYADLSSPKKARLDTSRSSEQMSEEELMLHLSESE